MKHPPRLVRMIACAAALLLGCTVHVPGEELAADLGQEARDPGMAHADLHTAPDLFDARTTFLYDRGAIVRGPRAEKVLAIVYTGGYHAEGGPLILDELRRRGVRASFFFTGDFLRRHDLRTLVDRVRDEGHYLGAHSDKHLLYATWESPPRLLVTRTEFDEDLSRNLNELARAGVPPERARFFLPPYEHHTAEIAEWTALRGMALVNNTRGTRSHADYLPDDHMNYISGAEIIRTILDFEARDPNGLSGFLLLMHIGYGPERTRDRLFERLGQLLDELSRRGYRFARVDDLLRGALP